ncbi:Uncharacterised protein [Vibrio cholerae]|nr:Uncharacterised protein [Vibrio cholerae]
MTCHFPLACWHIGFTLFVNINPRQIPKAKAHHPTGEFIYAHVIGDLIEEGIYRFFERFNDVYPAVAPT